MILGRNSRSVAVACLFLLLNSCSKDNENQIPYVPVDVHISLQEFQIKNVNGALTVPKAGVAGLIIIHKTGDTYAAYDRCSSVNPLQKCAVTIDESGLTATDPCSGAKFSLYDGTPVKAPATRSLKEYSVTRTSAELVIYN